MRTAEVRLESRGPRYINFHHGLDYKFSPAELLRFKNYPYFISGKNNDSHKIDIYVKCKKNCFCCVRRRALENVGEKE